MKQTFQVTGMTCSACSAHVEKAVGKTPGVSDVCVNLLANNMQVTYDEGQKFHVKRTIVAPKGANLAT